MRRFTSLTAAAAVVVTSIGLSAVPAEARHRHGGWGYRNHDRVDAGDVLGGLLIVGAIAAIATAASKDSRRDRDDRYDRPYPDNRDRPAPRYESQRHDAPMTGGYGADTDEDEDQDDAPLTGGYGADDDAARAADACGWAVEAEMGDDARVDRVDGTEPNNGGWYVTGLASARSGEQRSFGCSYRNGRVVDVDFRG